MNIDERVEKIILENQPKKKKRKFSILFYATIVIVVVSTFITIYSFKKTEKELGFTDSGQSIPEVIITNIRELFFKNY